MTMTITTVDADTIAEARARKRMRASAFVSVLLSCVCLPTLACPAAAEPFQQYKNADCGSDMCTTVFATPPTGKRLELNHVSCYLRMKGAHEVTRMELAVFTNESFQIALTPEAAAGAGASQQTVYGEPLDIRQCARRRATRDECQVEQRRR
jgi:hypothetical protein